MGFSASTSSSASVTAISQDIEQRKERLAEIKEEMKQLRNDIKCLTEALNVYGVADQVDAAGDAAPSAHAA